MRIRILHESYADLIPEDSSFASPFRPGMSAAVEIQTSKVANVIAVPIQAVTSREDLSAATDSSENNEDNAIAQEYVFIYESGTAVLRKVKTAVQDNQYIQIVSGLKKGEEVIMAPYTAIKDILKDGMQVKKVSQESLYSTP